MNTTTNMMERRVKERLVGATILVVLIVLIVPELLSGPKRPTPIVPPLAQGLPASTRSVSVDLTTNRAAADAAAAGAAAADAGAADSGAAPAASAAGAAITVAGDGGAASAGNAPSGEPREAAPGEAPAPSVTTLKAQEPTVPVLESRGPPPRSAAPASMSGAAAASSPQTRHAWAVQLGSFASRLNADKLVHQLQARGSPGAYIVSSGAGSSLRYRVRLGPLGDRAAAERAVAKLKAAGHAATIVTPAS